MHMDVLSIPAKLPPPILVSGQPSSDMARLCRLAMNNLVREAAEFDGDYRRDFLDAGEARKRFNAPALYRRAQTLFKDIAELHLSCGPHLTERERQGLAGLIGALWNRLKRLVEWTGPVQHLDPVPDWPLPGAAPGPQCRTGGRIG